MMTEEDVRIAELDQEIHAILSTIKELRIQLDKKMAEREELFLKSYSRKDIKSLGDFRRAIEEEK